MPRHVRKRAPRPVVVEQLAPGAVAALVAELPEWLAEFLLHRQYPPPGTANGRLLEQLMVDPQTAPYHGLLIRSKLAVIWKAHRGRLLARWAAEGRKREPWGTVMDRDPDDEPREELHDEPDDPAA